MLFIYIYFTDLSQNSVERLAKINMICTMSREAVTSR